ncbi:HelD family protein [Microbacterium arabinogalactanolyticum]|uniref:HelD family protein n=1 Tax=Microbacterium arabinogalactanolyticum TaxID=69365 RepID=UPI00404438E7
MTEVVVDKTEQRGSEQRAVERMYARLDAEKSALEAAQARVAASPAEGPESRLARDAELARLSGELGRLRLAERSLCFGRIDSSAGESMHVGRVGLRTESGEILLVDWRAAAARPFYAATPASPSGLRRRRHLRLDGRLVVGVSDEILDGTAPTGEDVVGDGPLVSALSGARTGRMREAASTLQREQDEIVRSEHRGVMVVDGGPGTGKTIVALHRAAYVLYAFPSVAERGVLVFGPNRRFLDYISDVLPSLGENDVDLATAADLVAVEATRCEPDAVARAKGRSAFAETIARKVRERQPFGVPLRLDTAHGPVVLDSRRVDAARRGALQGGVGHNRARELFLEYVVDDLVDELEQQTAKEMSDFEEELKEVGVDLDRMFARQHGESEPHGLESSPGGLDIDWDRIRDDLLDDAGIGRIVSEVWPALRAEDVLLGLLADPEALALATPELSDEQIASVVSGAGAGWSRADLAALDEARALVDGIPEVTYGHVVVDEAQQLSEMEWRMLMRRCPSRSMTIVGDLAQAGPTTTITRWEEALEPFVDGRYAHHTLTVNYRTTAEILDATRPVLARIAPSQRLSNSIRHGEVPSHHTVADADHALGDLVARVRDEHPQGLIGIIAAPRRIRALDAGFAGDGVTVVPAPDARGLEFDTVIVVDPDEIEGHSEAGLRDLYVAQTRATQRLITLAIAPRGGAAVAS